MSPPGAETPPPPPSNSKLSPASSKKPQTQQNTISLFAVQCAECMKWRLISNEDEYEDIRSSASKDPFVCSKKANVTCNDDPDIEYDTSRTWVYDKPDIPKAPTGFKRKLVLRRDFSKLDAYYTTPSGKKVRSGTEVAKYLTENPEIKGVNVDEFSFAVPKIVEETIPKHVERKTPAKGEKRVKEESKNSNQ